MVKRRPELSVIVPTLTDGSRRRWAPGVIDAYRQTLEQDRVGFELIMVEDLPSWGLAILQGLAESRGRFVLAAGDDAEPNPGWWPRVRERLDRDGGVVGPMLLNEDGSRYAWFAARDLHDGDELPFAAFPVAGRLTWERLQPLCPSHHYSDVYLAERARRLGIPVRLCEAWRMVHYCEALPRPVDETVYRVWRAAFGERAEQVVLVEDREEVMPAMDPVEYLREKADGYDVQPYGATAAKALRDAADELESSVVSAPVSEPAPSS